MVFKSLGWDRVLLFERIDLAMQGHYSLLVNP